MERITELKPSQIFVFGSNLAGRHGAGAAKDAWELFGAVSGVGEGPTGQCYALPTKDYTIKKLPLAAIENHVLRFFIYALCHPHLEFLVTPIGCGLAGYSPVQIGPLFRDAPSNVTLPEEFKPYAL